MFATTYNLLQGSQAGMYGDPCCSRCSRKLCSSLKKDFRVSCGTRWGRGAWRGGDGRRDGMGWEEEGWRWNSVVGVLNSHSSVALRQHMASMTDPRTEFQAEQNTVRCNSMNSQTNLLSLNGWSDRHQLFNDII